MYAFGSGVISLCASQKAPPRLPKSWHSLLKRNSICYVLRFCYYWEDYRNSNLDLLYPLHLRSKKSLFRTFSAKSTMCYLFCFKNIVHLQLFPTSGGGPPAFATPLMLSDDFFIVIAWYSHENPIRNLRLEHRFCKFAIFEKCFGFPIWTGYSHSIWDPKSYFFAISARIQSGAPF